MKLVKDEHAGVDAPPQLAVLDRNVGGMISHPEAASECSGITETVAREGGQVRRQVWLIRGNERQQKGVFWIMRHQRHLDVEANPGGG